MKEFFAGLGIALICAIFPIAMIPIYFRSSAASNATLESQISKEKEERIMLGRKVQEMDKLLKKMSKGLGYDGPEYWQ